MRTDWKLSEFKRLTAFMQQLADPEHKAHALTYLENHDQVCDSFPSMLDLSRRRGLTFALVPLRAPPCQARCVSRFASDAPEHRLASSKMLATHLLTLSGSLIIYEGRASCFPCRCPSAPAFLTIVTTSTEEIGMINAPKDWDIDQECVSRFSLAPAASRLSSSVTDSLPPPGTWT